MALITGPIFADGSAWHISAGNPEAVPVVSLLAKAMRLGGQPGPAEHRLVVFVDAHPQEIASVAIRCAEPGAIHSSYAPGPDPHAAEPGLSCEEPSVRCTAADQRTTICTCVPAWDGEIVPWLPDVSLAIAAGSEFRGGVLLHGGLVEFQGQGIIFAGPGGRGKSTTIARLPPPWRSLSDDAALVVRSRDGQYWAHPWPTWSRWLLGDASDTWDVQHAVRLRGIYFLDRAPHVRIEPAGAGHAVPLLVQVAEQINRSLAWDEDVTRIRATRLMRFDNICALAKAVPAYILHLSLSGPFWLEIERVLQGA